MTVQEIKGLLRIIKYAIQDANNSADYSRVRHLKSKKILLKQKIAKKNGN